MFSCRGLVALRSKNCLIGSGCSLLWALPSVCQILLAASPFQSCVTSLHTSSSAMPKPPYHYRSAQAPVLDLHDLGLKVNDAEIKRQDAFDSSRKIHATLIQAKTDMELPTTTLEETAETLASAEPMLKKAVGVNDSGHKRAPRAANLGNRVEEYLRLVSFHHFLGTGTLIPPSKCIAYASDEEYLAGACMGLCQDLARYGIGRATARDFASVRTARDLVQEILDYLLKFDFRNGYLRRKYDGTKYALKTLETLLYELSVTGASDVDQPESKRPQMGEATPLTASAELEDIRKRMEHRDELREKLIKRCRDGQKAAKQAIYALHRGDIDKAMKLLVQCQDCISSDLLPIIEEEPPLRSGSFSNVLEEYVEAKLFHVWLHGLEGTKNTGKVDGTLMKADQFQFDLEPEEFLGGLCDLTGEIGRHAVQRGTARDFESVQMCLEASSAVLIAIQTMERFPNGIGKKLDQLRRTVEKMERMTYEMSLSEATGRKVDSDAVQQMDSSTTEQ